MKTLCLIAVGVLFILALLFLSACVSTRPQRVRAYQTGAVLSGHPEAVPAIALLDQIVPAQRP